MGLAHDGRMVYCKVTNRPEPKRLPGHRGCLLAAPFLTLTIPASANRLDAMTGSNPLMRKDPRRSSQAVALSRAALSLLVAFLITACGQIDLSAAERIARAEQAHADGNINAAVIEIKNALQQRPNHAEARRLLGEYSLALGEAEEAEAELERAQALGSDPVALQLPLLRAWSMQGKHQQVIEATESVDAYAPSQQPVALTLRAQSLLTKEQFEEARATLDRALNLDPTNAEVLLGLAWVDWLNDDLAATRARLQATLQHDPGLDRAWELLGDVEREAGRLDEAAAAYTRAIETTNQPLSPRVKRALTNLSRQDADAVEADVNVLARRYATHPEVSFVRGLAALNAERFQEARRHLEETLYRNSEYVPAMLALGKAHYGLENWQQAESLLSRYISYVRNAPEASRLLAAIRMQGGRTYSAERALNAQLYRAPEDQNTLAMISNLYLAEGRPDEALHHLRHAIKLEPESAKTRAQLGLALMETGQREEGFCELERALELAPEQTPSLEVAMILERIRSSEDHERTFALLERLRDRDDLSPDLYYVLKGLAYVGQGDVETAKAVFREGIESGADVTGDLASNLASLLAREGQLQDARAIATEALEAHPDHLGLLLNLAIISTANGDREQTETLLERAVAAHPDTLRARRKLAVSYLETERAEQAVEILQPVEERHGQAVAWLRPMALARLRTGEETGAAEVLQRLRQLQPAAADVRFMLGRLLARMGDVFEAGAVLLEGIALQPDNLDARLLAVQLLVAENRLHQAFRVIEPARRKHPDNVDVLTQSGIVAVRQKRFTDAISDFEQAVAMQPENRSLTIALAQAQWSAGEQASALETMRQWLQEHPKDLGMRTALAQSYLAQDRTEEATVAFERVLEQQPDSLVALNELAELLRNSDPERALDLAESAVALTPKSGTAQSTLGRILLDKGDYPQAVAALRKAAQLTNNAPAVQLSLAKALAANGEEAEAKALLQGVIEAHLDSDERDEAQRILERLSGPAPI